MASIFDRFRRNKEEINPSAEVMQDVQNIDQDEGFEVTRPNREDERISTTLAYPSQDSIHDLGVYAFILESLDDDHI